MTEETMTQAIEDCFKKLTGSPEVNYEALYPGIGKGAVADNIVDNGDMAWQATLVRKFDYHNLSDSHKFPYQEVPTGEISSLAYLTQTPADYREMKAKVLTKIFNFGDSIDDRIEEAVTSQKRLRKLIDEDDLVIRNYASPISDRVTVKNYDGLADSFISITNKNKAGKKPKLPLSIIVRDNEGDPNFVQVLGETDHEIEKIIPALDYQIENFERVIGKKVPVLG
jgi:hypothetical protein